MINDPEPISPNLNGKSEDPALRATVERLKAWDAPQPTASQTAQLIARLQAELAVSHPTPAARPARLGNWREWGPLVLLRVQLRIVAAEIWIASALVMLLGILVTLVFQNLSSVGDVPLVLVAPVVAAIGLIFLYSTEGDLVREIEYATPLSPALILLTRLLLVFGFDFLLGLVGSFLIAWLDPKLALWPLVGAWLAPMAFLSAFGFLISVLVVDPLIGTLISFGLWTALVFIRLHSLNPSWIRLPPLPDLLAIETRAWLFVLAGPLLALGLWLNSHRDLLVTRKTP